MLNPTLRLALICSTALCGSGAALAQDCLSSGEDLTCINTGSLPDGLLVGGILDLTNSGSIGPAAVAVQTNSGGRIDNSGSIAASVFGVLTSGTLDLTNSGTIHGDAIAVIGLADMTVTNHGALTGIFGIFGTASVTALNFGSIIGSQVEGDSYGILGNVVDIDNRGTISGGFNGIGINISGQIANSGTITGTGIGPDYTSFGIMARGDLALQNSGTIQGEIGVSVNGSLAGTVIENDGWIIGTEGTAIDMTGLSVSGAGPASEANLLILRGQSRIDGGILLGAADTVQIETEGGISRLVTLTPYDGFLINVPVGGVFALGDGVFVQNGNSYATLDTTAFAQPGQGLLGLSQGVTGAIARQVGGQPAGQRGAVLSTRGGPNHAGWAAGFGAVTQRAATDLTRASDDRLGGLVGGMDLAGDGALSFGLLAGAAQGTTRVELSQEVDTAYRFAGLYAEAGGAAGWLTASVIGGATDSDSRRTVADNTAEGGLATGSAGFDGSFAALHLATGRDIATAQGVIWTPNLQLDAATGHFDSYAETGTDQDLTVAGRDALALSLRLGVERRQSFDLPGGTVDSLLSLALVETRTTGGAVAGTLLGQPFVTDAGLDSTATGLALGTGLTFALSPSATVSLQGEGLWAEDGIAGSGALSLNLTF